jgi:hypothetical protein
MSGPTIIAPVVREPPKLYVAVINYNGLYYSRKCLKSLEGSFFDSFRLILIDNASADDSAEQIRREFPNVEIVKLAENVGYTGGCNVALTMALARGAKYCFVLNNDTLVDAEALGHLTESADNNEGAAAVGPRIMDYSNGAFILSLGGTVDMRTGWSRHEGWGERFPESNAKVKEIDGFLDGSAIMFVLRNLESIGFFDERYFMYHDEVDWCYRARRAGFRLLLDARAVVRHKGRGTAAITDPRVQYLSQRSRILFLKKFASKMQWLLFWLRLPLELRPRSPNIPVATPKFEKRTTSVVQVVHALIDGLFGGDKFRDQYRFE